MLPRLPPKPARQNSFGSEPKRRRHDGHKFKRSGGDIVVEKGRLRAEAKGGHLLVWVPQFFPENKSVYLANCNFA